VEEQAQLAEQNVEKIDKDAERIDSSLKAASEKISDADGSLNNFEQQQQIISERAKFNTEKIETKLSQTSTKIKRLEQLETELFQVKDTFINLKHSIEIKLDSLKDLKSQLNNAKKSASNRHLYVERGDRTIQDKEYRPGSVALPYGSDILHVVFHKYQNEKGEVKDPITNKSYTKDIKRVWVDIYLNDKIKLIDKEFTEDSKPVNIPDTDYYIELIFIYLPNPVIIGGLVGQSIPDFIIFKVYML